jgi:U5 small nuclear ribonucleoprotein component
MNYCFTLRSFAKLYADTYGAASPLLRAERAEYVPGKLDVKAFAARLWGDIYFDEESRRFTRKQSDAEQPRTFVHFILNPLYKIYSQVLSEETDALKDTLATLGITLKPVVYKMDVRPLLKVVLDQFFGPSTGLVDVIVEHIPSPMENAVNKVREGTPKVLFTY